MGLTTWKGARITKADVKIAKNYLNQEEIEELNRIVVMWLDFAEDQARRRKQVLLSNWTAKLDSFLQFNERRVLGNAGSLSKDAADRFAEAQYEAFAAERRRLLEAEGERALSQELETRAADLPKRKGTKS